MWRLIACVFLILLSTAFLALPASGWGREGHHISGMIAWHYLNEKAKVAVTDLLDGESLGLASNWADDIRDDHSYDWAKPLHYVNVPKTATTVDTSRDCQDGKCVIGAIEKYSAILKDKTKAKADRVEALRFLIHFVEDVHQPMHVSYASDKGGNSLSVTFLAKKTNLHSLWDTGLIQHKLGNGDWMELAQEWQQAITPSQLANWSAPSSAKDWANESLAITRGLYADLPADHKLGASYYDQNITVVQARLSAAGVRLATLLNSLVGDQAEPLTPDPNPDPSDSGEVSIASLLPDPEGDDVGHEQVTLGNSADQAKSLQGWELRDRKGNVFMLSGSVPANGSLVVTMTSNSMPLNNEGDDVYLIDASGHEVQHVSYKANEVKKGKAIVFAH